MGTNEELIQMPVQESTPNIEYTLEETDSEMEISPRKYTGKVSRIADGDTFEAWVNGVKETIRMIGVNTPETQHSRYDKPELYSEEAEMTSVYSLIHKEVEIELDLVEADVYGRKLAWIWIDGRLFQEHLIQQGYAYIYTYAPNNRHADVLVEAQKKAREEKKGLWAVDFFSQAPEEEFGLDLTNTNLEILIPNIDQFDREQFILSRRRGLGASDMSILLNANPYQNMQNLIAQKLSPQVTPEEWAVGDIPAVRKGLDLEALIVQKIKEYFKMSLWKPTHMYRIKQFPHITINFDGVTGDREQYYPVEIKVLTYFGEKNYNPAKAYLIEGEPMREIPPKPESGMSLISIGQTYGIPPMYYIQLQTQMLGLNAPHGYLAVLPEKDWKMRLYHIWKDDAIQSLIMTQSFKFWDALLARKGMDYDSWLTAERSWQDAGGLSDTTGIVEPDAVSPKRI